MMRARFVLFTAFLLVASHALAQTPRTPQAPQSPPAPPAPVTGVTPPAPPPPPPPPELRRGQAINIKVDLTISEAGGTLPAAKKTVTTVAADGYSGSVREIAAPPPTPTGPGGVMGPISLNVDASPVILPGGKIRLTCTIQYVGGQGPAPGEARPRTDIRENLVLILDSGQPLVVSEASDPISDRKVTVEVRATILK